MVIRRGQVWWASPGTPVGSEPGFNRPVVVVQSDDFNRSLIRTVMVVIITSNIQLADAPGNVLLPRKCTKLPKDSVANVSQVVTLDKSFLTSRVSKLPDEFMADIEEGMRLSLDL
jgi:mRNA interferase MazF